MRDEGHNPLDPVEQERIAAERTDEERRQREKDFQDLRRVMGSKEGRRFVWRLLSEAGIYRSSFNTDPLVMARNEGARNRGLELLDEILVACPESYLKAQSENIEAKQKS